jgi:DNA-binding MarR family transcriptional regulator
MRSLFDLDEDAPTVDEMREMGSSTRARTHRRLQKAFVFGPIPMPQLLMASRLSSSKAVVIWLLIHYRVRLTKEATITLPRALQEEAGISKTTFHYALAELEQVGLVQVDRQRGRGHPVRITLVELPEDGEEQIG